MHSVTLTHRLAVFATASAALLAMNLASPASAAKFPPLNDPPTKEAHPGKFVWAELFTDDSASATKFYTGVFGWTAAALDQNGVAYTVFSSAGHPVAGLRQRGPEATKHASHWIHYIAVADIGSALSRVAKAGGEVRAPARRFPNIGLQAIVTDNEGSVVGLVQSASGDSTDSEPLAGEWNWAHLFSKSPKTAAGFYKTVFNYDVVPDDRPGKKEEWLLMTGGRNRSSVSGFTKSEDSKPGWLGVIRVANLDETLSRVPPLGGEVIVPPHEATFGSRFAAVQDPTGGIVGLVEYANNANPVSSL